MTDERLRQEGIRRVQQPFHEKVEAAEVRAHGIVLAGVHRWGGDALERVSCRPLLPVALRPLVWHVASWMKAGGIQEACICGNSDTAHLRRVFGDGRALGLTLKYYEDVMPRGPAGCARDAVGGVTADVFVAAEASILPRIELASLVRAHVSSGAVMTIVVADSDDGGDLTDSPVEPAGIYVFGPETLRCVPAAGYQDIKESLVPHLYRQGARVETYKVNSGALRRVYGVPSYLATHVWALQRLAREPAWREGMEQRGEAWVDPTARVDATARLVGPVLVGPGATIGAGAMLIGPTCIGASCRVGARVVLSRSVVWDGCTLGEGAIVDQSIVTESCTVEPGVVVRNTVYTRQRPATRTLLARLASYYSSGRRGRDASQAAVARRHVPGDGVLPVRRGAREA